MPGTRPPTPEAQQILERLADCEHLATEIDGLESQNQER